MSTPVEMIEALQKECLKDPDEFVPGTDVAFLEDVAKRLTPILAAAREQGSALCRQAADITNLRMELAAMKELMECEHPRFFWVGEQHVCDAEHECYESDTGCYPAHCRLCVQHSADLREARAGMREACAENCQTILESRDPDDARGIAAANLCAMGVESLPDIAADEAIERIKREARLPYEQIFKWLLGENGEFKSRPEGAGAYWWRTELRQRIAALSGKETEHD